MADTTKGAGQVDGPGRFSFTLDPAPDGTTVTLAGELDVYTSPRLKEALQQLPDDCARVVTFDVAKMDFVDSTGLGVLVSALTRSQSLDGEVRLRGPNPSTAKLLEITGLGGLFAVQPPE